MEVLVELVFSERAIIERRVVCEVRQVGCGQPVSVVLVEGGVVLYVVKNSPQG